MVGGGEDGVFPGFSFGVIIAKKVAVRFEVRGGSSFGFFKVDGQVPVRFRKIGGRIMGLVRDVARRRGGRVHRLRGVTPCRVLGVSCSTSTGFVGRRNSLARVVNIVSAKRVDGRLRGLPIRTNL